MSRSLRGACVLALAFLAGCGTDEVWNCQNAGATSGFNGSATLCETQWLCDAPNGAEVILGVRCSGSGDSLQCDCVGNGQASDKFTGTSAVCAGGVEVATEANKGCHWSLPEDQL
jgi:hypothetical protein